MQNAALRDSITEEPVNVRSACQSAYSDTECLPLDGTAHHGLQKVPPPMLLELSCALFSERRLSARLCSVKQVTETRSHL